MGKKGNWLAVVKKALNSYPKERKDQKIHKSKKTWFGEKDNISVVTSTEETTILPIPHAYSTPSIEKVELSEIENEESKKSYSMAPIAEVAVFADQDVAETRRALRALRGLVRLKSLMQGQSVKRQVATTLRCMQTLARVQSQIHARRIKMSEENQALHRQLQQKREKEIDKFRASMGEKWVDSHQSKEQIEAKNLIKQEAAMRREKALAYAFSLQKTSKKSSKSTNHTFIEPNNFHWGWSWLERWMATRPWERTNTLDNYHELVSIKSSTTTTKAYHQPNLCHDTTSAPLSKASTMSSLTRKTPKRNEMFNTQLERHRRHSIAGSLVIDNEVFVDSLTAPSYMAPTQSAKAKSRVPNTMGFDKIGTLDKGSVSSAKRSLSFAGFPTLTRRHSSPPKMDSTTIKHREENMMSTRGRR
ncbi:hypothetical protein G4B88_011574 [Cannabis sativa]|uniref:DUF4005 domain-containing protein n=1 Tax=Cannabis sativa TaxID=3483 RepID=A0A7J6GH49_CANSA|nr:hypothetical protein G4B88_011574 [Cannabis sativa]